MCITHKYDTVEQNETGSSYNNNSPDSETDITNETKSTAQAQEMAKHLNHNSNKLYKEINYTI